MTEIDTSTAPPRIWTWPVQVRVVCQGEWQEDEPTGDTNATQYVLADLYDTLAAERDALKEREQAIVAAAYEAAADRLRTAAAEEDELGKTINAAIFDCAVALVRALTPADARAALDRMLAELVKVRRQLMAATDARGEAETEIEKLQATVDGLQAQLTAALEDRRRHQRGRDAVTTKSPAGALQRGLWPPGHTRGI